MRKFAIVAALVASAIAALFYFTGARSPELASQGPFLKAALEQEWSGDGAPARQTAFSADGALLAITSAGGRVTIRRTRDWSVAGELTHPGGATAVAFARDGARLFTSGYDGVVRVWDLATRSQVAALEGAQGTVWSVDPSPDGQRLAAAGEDRIIRIWPLSGGAPVQLRGHERNVWEVRFSPDGRRLASGSFDSTLRIWDSASGAALHILTDHGQAVVGLDYSPDGRLIATGSDDSTIKFRRAEDGAPLRTVDSGNHVYKVAFSPDGRWLAASGRARAGLGAIWHGLTGAGSGATPARLWRVSDGALVDLLPHPEDVMYTALSPDGSRLVTSSEDGVARLWRLRESR